MLLSKATFVNTFLPVCVFPGNRTHNLCTANATLYHWGTGTLLLVYSGFLCWWNTCKHPSEGISSGLCDGRVEWHERLWFWQWRVLEKHIHSLAEALTRFSFLKKVITPSVSIKASVLDSLRQITFKCRVLRVNVSCGGCIMWKNIVSLAWPGFRCRYSHRDAFAKHVYMHTNTLITLLHTIYMSCVVWLIV